MSRYTRMLCSAFLAALSLISISGTALAQPLPCNFAAKVQFLAPGFIPDQFGTPPPGAPIGQPYASQLNQAFARAPVAFQTQLCNLDGVYIDQTVCANWQSCFGRSWGFRQRPGGRRYVAISIMLWSGQPIYSRFESALFDSLLAPNFASFGAANPDNFPMTLLAALAHEVGHVRFYDILDPGLTGTLDFDSVCGGYFFSGWAGPPNGLHAPPRWRPLSTPGERHGNPIPDPHRGPPQIQQIDALVQAGNTGQAGDLVNTMLTTQPWASFFAAISPDEDFVETYKLKVLTSAAPRLTSLPFDVPGSNAPHSIDIPAHISPDLDTKMSCIPL